MSESLEASTRRWSSNHVPHESTYKPKQNVNNIELIKEEEQQPLRSIEPREQIRSEERTDKIRNSRKPARPFTEVSRIREGPENLESESIEYSCGRGDR
jgi:hypothetical protein